MVGRKKSPGSGREPGDACAFVFYWFRNYFWTWNAT